MDAPLLAIIQKTLEIVFAIFALVAVGYFYGRRSPTDMSVANKINTDVFLPALIFGVMSSQAFSIAAYSDLAIAATLIIIGSGLLAWPISHLLGVRPKTFVPPMMFNNCGNLGLPLLVLAFGEDALPAAVMLFVVSNTLHFTLGAYMVGADKNPLNLLKQPMIAATLLGLVWSVLSWPMPNAVSISLDMLGQVSVPLLLFALGVRMNDVNFAMWRIGLWSAIVAPATGLVVGIPAVYLLDLSATNAAYVILFASLPPAVLNYIVAERQNQQPELVAPMVLIGNMGAVITIPVALFFVL